MRKKQQKKIYISLQLIIWLLWFFRQITMARLVGLPLPFARIALYLLLSTLFIVITEIFRKTYSGYANKKRNTAFIISLCFVLMSSFFMSVFSRLYSCAFLNFPGGITEVLTSASTIILSLNFSIQIGGWVLAYTTLYYVQRLLLQERKIQKNELTTTILEVSLLAQQYRPHFLFNSLNALRTLILVNPPVASVSIENMKLILTGYLNSNALQLVSLNSEIRVLNAYFFMQRVRFGEAFSFQLLHDEKMIDTKIPKGILLSMAENAIKHNQRFMDQIDINVSIKHEDNQFIASFTNNGFLKKDKRSTGIGLKGITGLMKYFYEDRFSLTLFDVSPNKVVSILCYDTNVK